MSYESERFDLMVKIEEGKNGPKTKVYLDSKGLMTIGVGFNIVGNKALRDAVLDAILPTDAKLGNDANAIKELDELRAQLVTYIAQVRPTTLTDNEKEAIYDELDRLVTPSKWTAAEKAQYPMLLELQGQIPMTFTLSTTQIRDIFDNVAAPSFETEVTHFIAQHYSDLALDITDNERIALFSLAYNNPKLLGPGLGTAIEEGNRAEAWFQIRYGSNGGSSASDGIAKRRYYESELFGVFANNNTPTVKEAKDFYRVWQENKDKSSLSPLSLSPLSLFLSPLFQKALYVRVKEAG